MLVPLRNLKRHLWLFVKETNGNLARRLKRTERVLHHRIIENDSDDRKQQDDVVELRVSKCVVVPSTPQTENALLYKILKKLLIPAKSPQTWIRGNNYQCHGTHIVKLYYGLGANITLEDLRMLFACLDEAMSSSIKNGPGDSVIPKAAKLVADQMSGDAVSP
eukprot:15365759-Ditylum_brightwellii.AAC.1